MACDLAMNKRFMKYGQKRAFKILDYSKSMNEATYECLVAIKVPNYFQKIVHLFLRI